MIAQRYEARRTALSADPQAWLVTGAAGFIGSNLCVELLKLGQTVRGVDNFSNGLKSTVENIKKTVGPELAERFEFVEGDLCRLPTCLSAMRGVRYVLHQAALGSVPRSLANPLDSHHSNVTAFLNMLCAFKDIRPERMVYASSSSVYGDSPTSPKKEEQIGRPLSPYAATKLFDEIYSEVFARSFDLPSVGVRYFNVFGPRQRPTGPYSAVIPRWIAKMIAREPAEIFGDGETKRDFSFVANVVQANLMAASEAQSDASGKVFNVAFGRSTSLNQLYQMICRGLTSRIDGFAAEPPIYKDFRSGDIRDSLADVGKAKEAFGYEPTHSIEQGLEETLDWYVARSGDQG